MYDRYKRDITYMRISVTDRCNLRCLYCMPDGIPEHLMNKKLLTFEEIVRIVEAGTKLGLKKIRLTGGEPLVRKGIENLVAMIKGVPGIELLGMTTNGIFLDRYASLLRPAGLDSLNISLDTLSADQYTKLTGGGSLKQALLGIEAARAEGFPIKINMVVEDETTDENLKKMQDFCDTRGLTLQTIGKYSLREEKVDRIEFNRPPKCGGCNRIRLLSDGMLKPCLHSDLEIPVDLENPEESLRQTILGKPRTGTVCTSRNIVEIGG